MAVHQKKNSIPRLILLSSIWIIIIGGISIATYIYSNKMAQNDLVYGEWIEVNAPSYDTDVFQLTAKGVKQNGRFVSSSFEFNGKDITYPYGNVIYHFEVNNADRTIIRRVSPKPNGTYFVKKGHEELFAVKDEPVNRNRTFLTN